MNKRIPYATQWIDEDDIQAVVEVLRSDWITQGPMIEKFEGQLAAFVGSKYAVAVSSGTAALHIATLAAELPTGFKGITSTLTFVASANCILYAGGQPRFVDIDPETHNLSISDLGKLLAREKTHAIIPVHFGGLPCDMEKIGRLAKEHKLMVIEDACHALGAEYQADDGEWVKIGSCRHSDMTTFSFHPVKHIATGEGGAVTTNSRELYEKLKVLRNHGITKDKTRLEKDDGPWYYEMQDLGFNYKITDFQCALGCSQLQKIDDWLSRRYEIANKYNAAFSDSDFIKVVSTADGFKSANHLYVIEVSSRNELFEKLRERNLGVQVHYIPVHLQPYYRNRYGYTSGDYPKSEAYYQHCISIPIYPKMSATEVDMVIEAVLEAVRG